MVTTNGNDKHGGSNKYPRTCSFRDQIGIEVGNALGRASMIPMAMFHAGKRNDPLPVQEAEVDRLAERLYSEGNLWEFVIKTPQEHLFFFTPNWIRGRRCIREYLAGRVTFHEFFHTDDEEDFDMD